MKTSTARARPPVADARGEMLALLAAWAEAGGLRWLDVSIARFLAAHAAAADATTLFAAAWVARAEGLGHSCVALETLRDEVEDALVDFVGPTPKAILKGLPSQAAAWIRSLSASGAVQRADELIDDGAPFVLDGDRLYLRRYWQYERDVASRVISRVSSDAEPVATDPLRDALARLLPRDPAGDAGTDWQKVACAIALHRRFAIVTGGPGTGKTFVAARVLALAFETAPDPGTTRIALAAPTGKAAARLKQSIDQAFAELAPRLSPATRASIARIGAATTLHALLGTRFGGRRVRRSAAEPLDIDLLIVDEASMINLEMMALLLDALPAHARLVLLGDKDQLASVEAGAVLGDLCRGAERGRYDERTRDYVAAVTGQEIDPQCVVQRAPPLAQQVVMLRASRRFDGDIAALAAAVNAGASAQASALLSDRTRSALSWVVASSPDTVVDEALSQQRVGYRAYVETVRSRPNGASRAAHDAWIVATLRAFDGFRVLSALRAGPWGAAGINRAIEARLFADDLLAANRTWYTGRPIMVTRNDYSLDVFNGDVGIALPAGPDDDALRVWFADGAGLRSIGVARLEDVETAYASTVHKAQGSEFDHTLLVLPPDAGRVATRELLYTAITRARRGFALVTGDEDSLSAAIERRTVRASGLADRVGL